MKFDMSRILTVEFLSTLKNFVLDDFMDGKLFRREALLTKLRYVNPWSCYHEVLT